MKSIIKGIILGILLSVISSPITVHAKAPTIKVIASDIAYSLQDGIQNGYCDYEIVLEPSGESWWDVWSNYGQGWWEIEEELNKNGIYLDENGMIMDGTVYTMPKN